MKVNNCFIIWNCY